MSIKNKTEHCSPGYWLCQDKAQCVLQGGLYHKYSTSIYSSVTVLRILYQRHRGIYIQPLWLCCSLQGWVRRRVQTVLQGKTFCICLPKPPIFVLQVYSETAGLSIIVLVVVIPLLLGFLLCLRSHLLTFILAVFTRSGESQAKSFHRNEVSEN